MGRHMTKLEKLLSDIKGLETPENSATIRKLMEGINMIADEQRRRMGIILEAAKDIEQFDDAEDEEEKKTDEAPAEEAEEKEEPESKDEKDDKDDKDDDIEDSRYFERACLILYAKNREEKPLTDWEAEILPEIIPLAEKLKEEMGDEKFDELIEKAKEAAKEEEEKENEEKEEKKEDKESEKCCENGECCKDSDCPDGEECVNGECKKLTESEGFAQLDKQMKASGLSRKAFLEAVGETIVKSSVPEETKEKMFNMLESYANHIKSKDTAFVESMESKFKASGMSRKAFVESVGKRIINSDLADGKKEKMLDTLGRYVTLTESVNMGTRWAFKALDDVDRKYLAEGNLDAFKKHVLERTELATGNDAQLKFDDAAALAKNKEGEVNEYRVIVTRSLIDTPDEKLLLLKPTDGTPAAYFLYTAR